MKRIISIVLLLALVACSLVACKKDNGDNQPSNTPDEKTYTLSVVVDGGLGSVNARGKATAIALALVWGEDGKIVAARFDSVEPGIALNADSTDITTVARVETKVEQGDSYAGMPSGSWAKQAKAFEDFIVGKTAAEVAALDTSNVGPDNPIVAGCTMSSSTPVFQSLVAKAFAYTRNVTFKTSEAVTLGLAIDAKVSGSLSAGATLGADFAATAMAGGKVVAAMLDSAEAKYDTTVGEDEKLAITLKEYKGTKNEQGDNYNMVTYGGAVAEWYAQAQAFANATVGKTAAEIEALDTSNVSSDNPFVAGCTIGVSGYQAAIVRAAGYAR